MTQFSYCGWASMCLEAMIRVFWGKAIRTEQLQSNYFAEPRSINYEPGWTFSRECMEFPNLFNQAEIGMEIVKVSQLLRSLKLLGNMFKVAQNIHNFVKL